MLLTFKHGIHPDEYKAFSQHLSIERMPFVEEYVVPMSQHIGAPSQPIVRKGQRVMRGEMIAKPGGFVSVAQHSPVTGTVTAVERAFHPTGQELPAVRIQTDSFSTQYLPASKTSDWKTLDSHTWIPLVQSAGLVGLGGAAFPAHVKFSIPKDKRCHYLLLNGCECEPYLTADHRVMLEQPQSLLEGAEILFNFLGAKKVYIGIESNKLDAIELLTQQAQKMDIPVEVIPLSVKYPQGAEKMLISAVLKQEVPSGKLPLDVETIVSNVGTTVALANFFIRSQPLIERVVTVTGPGIRRAANLRVPIGTPIRKILERCGGVVSQATRILMGGPMMGIAQKSLEVPVTKGTSGILVLTNNDVQELQTYRCVRCGRCLTACPIFLNPSRLGLLARKGLYDEMQEEHLMDCMECACCSFVCPSGIPLVQSFRVAKSILREKGAA